MADGRGRSGGATNKHDVEIARLKAQNRGLLIDRGARLLETMIYGGVALFALYYTNDAFKAATGVPMGVVTQKVWSFLKNTSGDRLVSWSANIVLILTAWRQNKLRLKVIGDKAEYEVELEKKIDLNRTSSGLLKQGDPPKED